MDNLTSEFELYKIANDFRFYFLHHLSQKAVENSWRSSINVQTNLSQNAFYFSQQCKSSTGIHNGNMWISFNNHGISNH